ncbi:MAG: hypothetical protein ACE5Q3_10820 [Alphaproteobacteria bacterium]
MSGTGSSRSEDAGASSPRPAEEEWLARALDYPYGAPRRSYILDGGRERPFDPDATDGRVPVVAYGSNQSPRQLRRKFGQKGGAPIPVERARLAEHDVVYSAHLSMYGAVPAALRHVPGTMVDVAVTWLDQDQLVAMHTTEVPNSNYGFARLEGIALALEGGGRLETAYVYLSIRGHLALDGAPVALAEVRADGRGLGAAPQSHMLARVRDRLEPGASLSAFVAGTLSDHGTRRARIAALAAHAIPAAHPPGTMY